MVEERRWEIGSHEIQSAREKKKKNKKDIKKGQWRHFGASITRPLVP
jgi:hypothetical protein